MALDIVSLFAEREPERYGLHTRHLNEQMVRVLKAIGYDVGFRSGRGQYLYDRDGVKYLDLLSGWGVFAIGRNHPAVRDVLKRVLDADLPNLVQMDVSALAGVLAERLLKRVPYCEKVFFANSGTEAVEAAIKFARAATGRPGLVYCGHGFHGLSYGSVSLVGDDIFRQGLGPFLPDCSGVPFNDLAALERALASKKIAAFMVEPIQGKGVNLPADDYLKEALALCRKHGTLMVADEIQSGMGRTGRFLAHEWSGVSPDIATLAKGLGAGFPVGACLATAEASAAMTYGSHGTTFGGNPLAMAVGAAVLDIILDEKFLERVRRTGLVLKQKLAAVADTHPGIIEEIRGEGLMLGIKCRIPNGDVATAARGEGLLVVPAGDNVVRLLPPLIVTEADVEEAVRRLDTALVGLTRRAAAE